MQFNYANLGLRINLLQVLALSFALIVIPNLSPLFSLNESAKQLEHKSVGPGE